MMEYQFFKQKEEDFHPKDVDFYLSNIRYFLIYQYILLHTVQSPFPAVARKRA